METDFENQLKNCRFFQQIIAELNAQHTALRTATAQALAVVATAAARQTNADVFAQNIERMEKLMARQIPNPIRSDLLATVTSLVRNSGTPAGEVN